jgi:hypothetical protein
MFVLLAVTLFGTPGWVVLVRGGLGGESEGDGR